MLIYKPIVEQIFLIWLNISIYSLRSFKYKRRQLIKLRFQCCHYIIFWANMLTFVIKVGNLFVLFLTEVICYKCRNSILFVNIFKQVIRFRKDTSHIMLMLRWWFRKLIICPNSLPKDGPVKVSIFYGLFNVEGYGLDILLICDFTSVYYIWNNVWIKFFQLLGLRWIKILRI